MDWNLVNIRNIALILSCFSAGKLLIFCLHFISDYVFPVDGVGLADHDNYHEFCRLLGRFKVNYQVSHSPSPSLYLYVQLYLSGVCARMTYWQVRVCVSDILLLNLDDVLQSMGLLRYQCLFGVKFATKSEILLVLELPY